MNFQLRFSPSMLPIYEAIEKGLLGDLVELEVHVNVHTPWELWPFLKTLDRVEVPLHSIHYIDWIRSVLGNPKGVYCQSVKHPKVTELADCRTSAIFNYGDQVRCCMSINHSHSFGKKHQDATIRLEGTEGAAKVTLGLLMNYPEGEDEKLEIYIPNGPRLGTNVIGFLMHLLVSWQICNVIKIMKIKNLYPQLKILYTLWQ